MYFLFKLVAFNFLLKLGNCSTTFKNSQKNIADLCLEPRPINETDFDWLITRQPPEGLHSILGNDIIKLHFAEYLKGEKLSLSDNFDSMCSTLTIEETEFGNTSNGKFFGFGNLTSNWNCKFSKDFPLVFVCDVTNPNVPKYHGKFHSYISYTDNSNFEVEVYCFPNGQVGWNALALSKSFTGAETKIIIDHIKKIGFSDDNIVTLYEEKFCTFEIY